MFAVLWTGGRNSTILSFYVINKIMNVEEANLSSIIVTNYGICDSHAMQIGS